MTRTIISFPFLSLPLSSLFYFLPFSFQLFLQGTAQSEAASVGQLKNGGAYVTFNGSLVRHADSGGIVAGLVQGIGESACKRVNMMKDARGIRYGYALFSPSGKNLRSLMEMAEKGILQADVDKVFPLSQIAQAYEYCTEAGGSGKVVINVAEIQ